MIAGLQTAGQLAFADRRSAAQRALHDVRGRLLTLERRVQELPIDRRQLRAALLNLAFLCQQGAEACPHGDTSCPCQDGDACHYEDTPGSSAAPSPMCLARHVPRTDDRQSES